MFGIPLDSIDQINERNILPFPSILFVLFSLIPHIQADSVHIVIRDFEKVFQRRNVIEALLDREKVPSWMSFILEVLPKDFEESSKMTEQGESKDESLARESEQKSDLEISHSKIAQLMLENSIIDFLCSVFYYCAVEHPNLSKGVSELESMSGRLLFEGHRHILCKVLIRLINRIRKNDPLSVASLTSLQTIFEFGIIIVMQENSIAFTGNDLFDTSVLETNRSILHKIMREDSVESKRGRQSTPQVRKPDDFQDRFFCSLHLGHILVELFIYAIQDTNTLYQHGQLHRSISSLYHSSSIGEQLSEKISSVIESRRESYSAEEQWATPINRANLATLSASLNIPIEAQDRTPVVLYLCLYATIEVIRGYLACLGDQGTERTMTSPKFEEKSDNEGPSDDAILTGSWTLGCCMTCALISKTFNISSFNCVACGENRNSKSMDHISSIAVFSVTHKLFLSYTLLLLLNWVGLWSYFVRILGFISSIF